MYIKKFYLNYVGCKVLTIQDFSLTKYAFYLNYVGCKVGREPTTNDEAKFYLNYVGCKGFNVQS